ncbi:hypothetical protein [Xanthomonas euvesicatoria]|uniref:hypothetical protein n=1 Tax=Xanthomonas euvesicatoria TaxID=456327 RepID=UPI001C452BAC|nr:hypothetical protein [Xanthomonas euvesicatoria]MBV6798848.1 hypothetical protein [Xanthomonas campestris pv. obscurae]
MALSISTCATRIYGGWQSICERKTEGKAWFNMLFVARASLQRPQSNRQAAVME